MSRPTDRSTARVETVPAKHLADDCNTSFKGADSHSRTSVHSSSTQAGSPERVGHIALRRLRSLLSERDLAIIQSVDSFRYLSGGQIIRLHFDGHASEGTAARTARSVLTRLVGGRMLRRTERRIGGVRAGSSSYVYGIGSVGHRLLHDDGSRGRWDEPSPVFLEHTLAIADLAIDLTQSKAEDQSLQIETEPGCWRSFTRGLGGREVLKPDLFISLASAEYEDRWFIEIDLATESTTAVRRKCQTYLDYHRSGIEQQRHEVFPRVLWIVPTARRQRQIEGIIAKLKAPAGLFVVTTVEQGTSTILGDNPADKTEDASGGPS